MRCLRSLGGRSPFTGQIPPMHMEDTKMAGSEGTEGHEEHKELDNMVDTPTKPIKEGDLDHVHPIIKKAMSPVMKNFNGKITILEIMDAAKVGWRDMPMLEKCRNKVTGYCEVCWNHRCGKCILRIICQRKKCHMNLLRRLSMC
jgi:hypothetical protein